MYEHYLITYDIRHPVRLHRLAKIAEDYGLRMQKSVFEANMTPPELQSMKKQMWKVIDPSEDGIEIFRLCQACEAKRTGAGIGLPELPDAAWHIF